MTDLRLVADNELDQQIEGRMKECRELWAGIGAKMLLFESRKTDTERYCLLRDLEAKATELSILYDELVPLVEKREERA